LTKEEIGEVLLQTGVYCGIAAAEDSRTPWLLAAPQST
jgi:alkylhydroperoxidase/carboxymuconolactone decarboxylase family protein YurZ